MLCTNAADALDTDFVERIRPEHYWLVTMKLDTPDEAVRDAFLETCHARGLLCRPVWKGMHHLPMYRDCPRAELTDAEALEAQIVNLPSSAILGMDRKRVIVENGEPRIDR